MMRKNSELTPVHMLTAWSLFSIKKLFNPSCMLPSEKIWVVDQLLSEMEIYLRPMKECWPLMKKEGAEEGGGVSDRP